MSCYAGPMTHVRSLVIPLCLAMLAGCASARPNVGAAPAATPATPATPDAGPATMTPPSVTEPDAGPAIADAAAPSADAATAPVAVVTNALTFRPGARPPRGRLGAHGATVWSVVVAAGPMGHPDVRAVFQHATAEHLAATEGQPSCATPVEGGYPATVPAGDSVVIVSVSFSTEPEARRFGAALVDAPLWIGRVRVTCAD